MAAANNGSNSNTLGSTAVVFSYQPSTGCIPEATMQELVRRLSGSVDVSGDSGYVRSTQAPADLTATWVPVDANGNRTGNNKVYNPTTGQWVDDYGAPTQVIPIISLDTGNLIKLGSDQGWYVGSDVSFQTNIGVAGDGSRVITFPLMSAQLFNVNIQPRTDIGANPNWRYYIESIVDGSLSIKFLGFDATIAPLINLIITITPLR